MNEKELAKKVLEMIAGQQAYFKAARTGAPVKTELLEKSKQNEREIVALCRAIIDASNPKQETLF